VIVERAAVAPGNHVVEIGCGTGALLVDVGGRVGADGRVIGIEPQPDLVARARETVEAARCAGAVEVWQGSAGSIALADATVDACLAQTVLIHFPQAAIAEALAECCRVLRVGGRMVSADQDGDTWIIDHPDRELTRRIVAFNSDQRYADGWTGRRLRRYFLEAGLLDVAVVSVTHQETTAGPYLHRMATRIAAAAVDAGVITSEEAHRWLSELDQLVTRREFFSSINYYVCSGRRPPSNLEGAGPANA
jgi:ubiquinone/menaquinone biosynthesis C-methylase UbiE